MGARKTVLHIDGLGWPRNIICSYGHGNHGKRGNRLTGNWSSTATSMSTKLSRTGSEPVNSPATGSNRTGFAVSPRRKGRPLRQVGYRPCSQWADNHPPDAIIQTVSREEWKAPARRFPSVLAQRTASEGRRWTRAPREPARPSPGLGTKKWRQESILSADPKPIPGTIFFAKGRTVSLAWMAINLRALARGSIATSLKQGGVPSPVGRIGGPHPKRIREHRANATTPVCVIGT